MRMPLSGRVKDTTEVVGGRCQVLSAPPAGWNGRHSDRLVRVGVGLLPSEGRKPCRAPETPT